MMVDSKGNPKPRRTIESTEPFYWEKLEHQYAGMAMQGIISNEDYLQSFSEDARGDLFEDIARVAADIAHALVGKLKEKEERK